MEWGYLLGMTFIGVASGLRWIWLSDSQNGGNVVGVSKMTTYYYKIGWTKPSIVLFELLGKMALRYK